ncbi:MAG: hypothetical protein ACK55I_44505, partial [bacterium]
RCCAPDELVLRDGCHWCPFVGDDSIITTLVSEPGPGLPPGPRRLVNLSYHSQSTGSNPRSRATLRASAAVLNPSNVGPTIFVWPPRGFLWTQMNRPFG